VLVAAHVSYAVCRVPALASAPQTCSTTARAVAGGQPSIVNSAIASSIADDADISARPFLRRRRCRAAAGGVVSGWGSVTWNAG
jgi:hypothetical protein